MTLISYKEAQSNRMCYKKAQFKRMSIVGEGIECLVTKCLHTYLDDKIYTHPFRYIALRWSAAC